MTSVNKPSPHQRPSYPEPYVKTLPGAVRMLIALAAFALGWLLIWGGYEAFTAIFKALNLGA